MAVSDTLLIASPCVPILSTIHLSDDVLRGLDIKKTEGASIAVWEFRDP